MKKLLPYILILVVLAGIFSPQGFLSRAEAQTGVDRRFIPIDGSTPINPESLNPSNTVTPSNSTGANAANATGEIKPPQTVGCISFSIASGLDFNLTSCVASLMYLIMWIFSWILWIAGMILDQSIFYTLHMTELMQSVPVVDIGWTIFRDLANIFFIFILLWTAISTILGLSSGKNKEILVNLIVVALLMNFSLFITKAVVDASNIVALHFYSLITAPVNKTTANSSQNYFANLTPRSSFSGAFMEGLKIQTLYSSETAAGKSLEASNNTGSVAGVTTANSLTQLSGGAINMGKIVLVGILGITLMMVAAYVFFVAAILFIIRAVVLMMVMMLSPLAFLAFILPATEGYADKWKESLISQSLFAPIYLSLCFVVVKTIQSDAFQSVTTLSTGADTLAGVFTGSSGAISLLFNFILLIALMLGSILVAKTMEAKGVETAIEMGKEARGFVGRTMVRGTYVNTATGTVGWGMKKAGRVAEQFGFKDFGQKLQTRGTKLQETGDKLQKKMDINEFDKRFKDSKFGATGLGAFIREKTTGGALFGTAAKFGAEKSVKEAYEEDEKLKSRRFALEKMDEAENAVKRLKIAQQNRLPEMPDWQNKKYKDASGNFDQVKFDADFKKFAETLRPQLSVEPKHTDYANTPEGQKEFERAEKRYKYEQSAAGQTEYKDNVAFFEAWLKRQPKRAAYTGPTADKDFAADQKEFEEKFTKPPVESSYSTPALYAQAKKIYDDRQDRKATADNKITAEAAAVGYAMNQIAPEEFARMHEEQIMEMARYANLRQLKAVMASEDWTVPEKQEMLGPRWAVEIQGFKNFSENVIRPYNEALEKLNDAIKDKKLDLDESNNIALRHDDDTTQQIVTDPATGKKFAVFNDGSGTKLEIPTDPKLPSELKAWARNKMTKEEYELASSISPQLFDNPDLVHVIRWGLTNKEFRTDENMPFDLRERLTYMKDSNLNRVVEGAHDPDYIPEDTDGVRKTAVAAATAAAKAAVQRVKRDKDGNEVLDSAGKKIVIETIEQARERAFRRTYAKLTPNDSIRNRITTEWATGRAANEIAGARSRNRNSKAVHRLIDKGLVQFWKEKDTEDIVFLLNTVLKDYLDEEEGKGIVSDKNRDLLNYLFTDPRCTIPKSNAMGALKPELQVVYRTLEEEGKKGPNKLKFKSDEWKNPKTP